MSLPAYDASPIAGVGRKVQQVSHGAVHPMWGLVYHYGVLIVENTRNGLYPGLALQGEETLEQKLGAHKSGHRQRRHTRRGA
jgi:hypothetical protein